jgi:hypothetical protein
MLVGYVQVWTSLCSIQIHKETWQTQEIYTPAHHLGLDGRSLMIYLRYVWGVLLALLTWWVACAVLKGPSAVASEALGPSLSVTLSPHVFLPYLQNLSDALKYAKARSHGRMDCNIAFSAEVQPVDATDYHS